MARRKRLFDPAPVKPLSQSEFEKLKKLLRGSSESDIGDREAVSVAMLMHEAALSMRYSLQMEKTGRRQSDFEAINKFVGLSNSVASYLERLDDHHPLIKALESKGLPTRGVPELVQNLRQVSEIAGVLASNREEYRRAYNLPEPSANAASLESTVLSPVLFKIWFRFRQNLELSESGPLMEFLRLAHRHAGIREPKLEAVRSARRRLESAIRGAVESDAPEPVASGAAKEISRTLLELQALYGQTEW